LKITISTYLVKPNKHGFAAHCNSTLYILKEDQNSTWFYVSVHHNCCPNEQSEQWHTHVAKISSS